MIDLLAMTSDINGKPIPVWQERLELLYTAGAPFGEFLSLVRALIDDRVVERILNMSDEEALASVADPDQFATEMRQKFDTIARLVRERDELLVACKALIEHTDNWRKYHIISIQMTAALNSAHAAITKFATESL